MQGEKDQFIQALEREYEITVKVLKAYPSDKLEMKPAEKLRSARDLAWVFAAEQAIAGMVVKGKIDFSGPTPAAPKTLQEILAGYSQMFNQNLASLKALPEADYGTMMDFPVGPGKMAKMRKVDVLWTTLVDMIHHRGQFSVYLRLAGAKVPSIYGPTADEPWN